MSTEIITTTGRGIQQITAEIRVITGQARQYMAHTIIELGRRLTEAKALVPAGEWMEYLAKEVEYSESTAENYMRIFREYGDQQQSLFAQKSESLLNLPYTKLVQLLAVPAEERAEFAEQVDAENISTRELKEAISAREKAMAERDQANQRAESAEAARRAAVDELDLVRQEDRKTVQDLKEAREKADVAEKTAKAVAAQLEKAKEEAEKARQEAAEAKAAKAQVPEDVMEQLRADARQDAAEAAKKEMDAKVAALQKKVNEAEAAKDEAEKKLEAAVKAQQMSNPEAAAFKAMFGQVQEDFNKLTGYLIKIQAADQELAGKLRRGVTALLDKLKEEVKEDE